MKEDKIENRDIIKKTLEMLRQNAISSQLPNNEKNALIMLIEKLDAYYDRKLTSLMHKPMGCSAKDDRLLSLESFMTDVIVEINTVLQGDSDVYYFVSIVNKRLNDKEIEKIIKSKKR